MACDGMTTHLPLILPLPLPSQEEFVLAPPRDVADAYWDRMEAQAQAWDQTTGEQRAGDLSAGEPYEENRSHWRFLSLALAIGASYP